MASEPFEATDADGNTVRGTVDVFRDPNGDFFNPRSQYYQNPRYADRNFDYFNPREACKIDRATLSRAMQEALRNALIRFGIPEPHPGAIEQDVINSIAVMRQRCVQNANKFVSDETNSPADLEADRSAAPSGSRNPSSYLSGVSDATASLPMQRLDEGTQLPNEDIRYLSRRSGNGNASVFDASAAAAPLQPSDEFAPGDRQEVLAGRFENRKPSFPASATPALNQPAQQREATRSLGLVSGEPMPDWPVPPPIWGFPSSRRLHDEDRQDWIARLLRSASL